MEPRSEALNQALIEIVTKNRIKAFKSRPAQIATKLVEKTAAILRKNIRAKSVAKTADHIHGKKVVESSRVLRQNPEEKKAMAHGGGRACRAKLRCFLKMTR
jgi:uncharacterized protein (DUF2252 family)